jgi:hypothetical protein
MVLALAYYLWTEREAMACLVMVITGGIYPPVFGLQAIVSFLSLFCRGRVIWQPVINLRRAAWLGLAAAAGAVMILPAIVVQVGTARGPMDQSSGSLLAAYSDGGRWDLFTNWSLVGRAGITESGLTMIVIVALAVLTLVVWQRRPEALITFPVILKLVALAGVAGFGLAWLALAVADSFILYLPSRYTGVGLPVFLVLFVASHVHMPLRHFARSLAQPSRALLMKVAVSALALMGLTFLRLSALPMETEQRASFVVVIILLAGSAAALVIVLWQRRLRPAKQYAAPSPTLGRRQRLALVTSITLMLALAIHVLREPLYEERAEIGAVAAYLQSVPKDTLVGGAPCALDSVPLLARRSVIFSCERVPAQRGDLIIAGLEAYYAESLETTLAYCHQYGVDYLVVDRALFEPTEIDKGQVFFSPYQEQLDPPVSERHYFALDHVADKKKALVAGSVYVVACDAESLQVEPVASSATLP